MEEEIVSEDAKERERTVLGDKRERKKEMEGATKRPSENQHCLRSLEYFKRFAKVTIKIEILLDGSKM